MHNGQIGGFEEFRRHADMLLPDAWYRHRKGATDSELLFLLALAQGLDHDPLTAMRAAIGEMQRLSEAHGRAPHIRVSAAFSDGKTLWALRSASDKRAPSLYYRRDTAAGGWCVSSEPLDSHQQGWKMLENGTLARFTETEVDILPITKKTFPA